MLRTILLIIAFVMVWIMAINCNSTLKKNATKFYVISIIICIAVTVVMLYSQFYYDNFPKGFFNTWYMMPYRLIQNGLMGAAIWSFVMLARHIPNTSVKTKVMSVRSELSIIGFFLTFPQTFVYTVGAFSGITSSPISLIYPLITAIYLILLLVLGITSFPKVRNKMSAVKWKKIQKYAYVFYYLLFVQLIFISLRRFIGSISYDSGILEIVMACIRVVIYLAVFVMWHILKSRTKRKIK